MKFHTLSFLTFISVGSLSQASFEDVANPLEVPRNLLQVPWFPSICDDDTTVNFNISFDIAAFSSEFQSHCTCSDTININEVFSTLPDPTVDIVGFLDAFIVALGQIFGQSVWNCQNELAICYDNGSTCGLVTATVTTSIEGRMPNLTLEDLSAAVMNPFGFIDIRVSTDICIIYNAGISGETCFSMEFVGTIGTCTLSYNDNDCTCNVELVDGKHCITSTCNGEIIDTCAGIGVELNGPFGILRLYNTDAPLSFTVGSGNTVKPDSININNEQPSSDVQQPSSDIRQSSSAVTVAMTNYHFKFVVFCIWIVMTKYW